MKKRILSMALTAIMLLSVLPVISQPAEAALPRSAVGQPYDGVDFNALIGNQVYFGVYQHATRLEKGNRGGAVEYERTPTPVLYDVMGEDPHQTEGSLALMSHYVIATRVFRDVIWDGRNEWHKSNLREWLNKANGTFRSGQILSEFEAVKVTPVRTGAYLSGSEVTKKGYGQKTTFPVTTNDYIYVPWTNGSNGSNGFVSWSAGNTLSGTKITRPGATLKNGIGAIYWTRTPYTYDPDTVLNVMDGIANALSFGLFDAFTDQAYEVHSVLPDGTVYSAADATDSRGVRPAFRIDSTRILFASEIVNNTGGRKDLTQGDLTNYIAGTGGQKRYKLTIASDSLPTPKNVLATKLGTNGLARGYVSVSPDGKLIVLPGDKIRLSYTNNYYSDDVRLYDGVAYKIVDNKTRKIVGYSNVIKKNSTSSLMEIDFAMNDFYGNKLPNGEYTVYLWNELRVGEDINSVCASYPQYFPVDVMDEQIYNVQISNFTVGYTDYAYCTTCTVPSNANFKVTEIDYYVNGVKKGPWLEKGTATFRFRLQLDEGHVINPNATITVSGQPAKVVTIGGNYYVEYSTNVVDKPVQMNTLQDAHVSWQIALPSPGQEYDFRDYEPFLNVSEGIYVDVQLSPNHDGRILPDTVYTHTVSLTTKPGYIFNPSTTFYVEGGRVTPTSYSDNSVVLKYVYPKTASATYISTLNIAGITAPVVGAVPNVNIPKIPNTTLRSIKWSPADATFKADTEYTVSMNFGPDNGYLFTDTPTVTINGEVAPITYKRPTRIDVEYTFTATDGLTPLNALSINGITAPVTGNTPSMAVSLPTGVSMESMVWEPADATFMGDTEYTLKMKLTAQKGYKFTDSTIANLGTGKAEVSGKSKTSLELEYTFPATTKPKLDPVVVSYPAGREFTVAKGAKLSISAAHNPIPADQLGEISYRWAYTIDGDTEENYYNAFNGDNSTLQVDTSKPGVYYYYCIITNTKHGVSAKPDTDKLQSVKVTVTGDGVDVFPFTDVAASAWYRKDVETAYKNGLINGKTATTFAPEENMTVAEAVKLAACMHQLHHTGSVTLENGSPWYATFMQYALTNKIIESDLTSRANEKITRKEFVFIFHASLPAGEFVAINTVANGAIPDVSPTAMPKYAPGIYTFYRAGILTGSDAKGTFNPDSNIKRNEVAAILTRMFDASARRPITLN